VLERLWKAVVHLDSGVHWQLEGGEEKRQEPISFRGWARSRWSHQATMSSKPLLGAARGGVSRRVVNVMRRLFSQELAFLAFGSLRALLFGGIQWPSAIAFCAGNYLAQFDVPASEGSLKPCGVW